MNIVRNYASNTVRIAEYPERDTEIRYEVQKLSTRKVDGKPCTNWHTTDVGTLLQCITLIENGKRIC